MKIFISSVQREFAVERKAIWRRGYGKGPVQGSSAGASQGASRGASQGASRGASQGASQGVVRVLLALVGSGGKSSSEIGATFGLARANSYVKRLISAQIDDGNIETIGVRKKGARLQRYRLTAKGRALAAKLSKGLVEGVK